MSLTLQPIKTIPNATQVANSLFRINSILTFPSAVELNLL